MTSKPKTALLAAAIALLLWFSVAWAKEYGSYDIKRILTVSETPAGKKYGLDRIYLDQIIDDLSVHAINYPPHFDSAQDKQRAAGDARALSGMLDILVTGENPSPEILLRAGLVNSIGHNLDIKGSAKRAETCFERLLAKTPDHPKGNYLYGMFLAGTAAKHKESIPYLVKALNAGVVDAGYTLGLVHLSLGEKDKAIEYLQVYGKHVPSDTNVPKLIEAIRSGNVEIKSRTN